MATTPTQIQRTQVGFSPEVEPYAKDLLAMAAGLTDINQNPYMQYMGERFAQFMPLQQQAFMGAGQMQAAPQMQTGSDIAAYAAQMGLGYGNYDPMRMRRESFRDPGTAQSFMSPYMQNVVQRQQMDARRQADIAAQQQQAQAARAGAFGGSRDAIMRAEANRGLQSRLGDIQAQGLQSAFQQGQAQFNQEQAQRAQQRQLMEQSRQFGAGLGIQGLQTALSGAGQLGQLGQGQFGQNLQALQLQNQFGTQQQQQVQNILNQQYQDFLNAQNYPYKQLGFMSDIIRGVPLTQTGATLYQAPPSATQQLTSLGLGAAGLSKLMKKGGVAKSKPEGLAALMISKIK